MTFKNLSLSPEITKAIKYAEPSPIQAQAIPLILAGKDILASAQTGTGKTAAFVLPALQHLINRDQKVRGRKKPKILILAPTRELVNQISQAAKDYGKNLPYSVSNITGGVSYRRQLLAADIIVATPGRLNDYLDQGKIDLSVIEMFILDEVDRMLDMGFIEDVRAIVEQLPGRHQTLFFSATIDKRLMQLAQEFLYKPERIEIAAKKEKATLIEQKFYLTTDPQQKHLLLKKLLKEEKIFKAIIFSATKNGTVKLAKHLNGQGYLASAINGDLKQSRRNATIEELRKDKIQFLVATDVAARGIDINNISHVINYDFPRGTEDYVHRIGRTGRAGQTGTAITMVLPVERRRLKQIESYFGKSVRLIKE